MADFVMPSLGADMEAGTLVAWRRKPGDLVRRGDVIAEVETEKGLIEVEVFSAGVIEALLVTPGTKVPVGTLLARLHDEAEPEHAAQEAPAAQEVPAAPQATGLHAMPVSAQASVVREVPAASQPVRLTPAARKLALEAGLRPAEVRGTGRHRVVTRADVEHAVAAGPHMAPGEAAMPTVPGRIKVSPFARRCAAEWGMSFDGIAPTGPDGSIVATDVERARQRARDAQEKGGTADALARMRRAIAAAMSRSKREIPHYYLSHTIDMSRALSWLEVENEHRGVKDRVLPAALLLHAVARAVRAVPELNAHFDGEGAPPVAAVHLGVAISLRQGGLVAPAIFDADKLGVSDLMRAFKDLVKRTRAGQLRAHEMAAATITVTSLGDRGVEAVFPIIIPPQVAMVGFGKIVERALVVNGAVVARPSVTATLAADHRVSDGHRGGLFLAAVESILKEPFSS